MLFAATAINYVDRQIIGVLKPTLQLEYGWTESAFASVVFWFQAAYAVGYLGFGKLIDRFGARLGYAASPMPSSPRSAVLSSSGWCWVWASRVISLRDSRPSPSGFPSASARSLPAFSPRARTSAPC
jgi:MFS family permease